MPLVTQACPHVGSGRKMAQKDPPVCAACYFRAWRKSSPERHRAYLEIKSRSQSKNLRKKYYISERDFEALLRRQGGGCALCGSTHGFAAKRPTSGRESRRPWMVLNVDHDHGTGSVRGLLCSQCNFSVGTLDKHGTEWLNKARAYVGHPDWTAEYLAYHGSEA